MNRPKYLLFKKCKECNTLYHISNFHKHKLGKYGVRNICKQCRAKFNMEHKEEQLQYNKQYREKNRERILDYCHQNRDKRNKQTKEWRKQNAEYVKQYRKQYQDEHKEEIREYHKQYRQTPQGQIKNFNSNSNRRTKEENQGSGITKDQWLEMMNFFNWKCAYSGEDIGGSKNIRSIDHIVALDNGGLNEIWNCVPMYRSYNCSKRTQDMEEWYKKQDFYSEERLQKIYEWQEYAWNKWGNKKEE